MSHTVVREIYSLDLSTRYRIPLLACPVPAGFPSPADDYIDAKIDLNKYLIKHPAATFAIRASGDSMIDAGIRDGDILLVDRALEAADGKIVIAIVDGEMTVKRIQCRRGKLYLMPENPEFSPILIEEGNDFQIWGVVITVIHNV